MIEQDELQRLRDELARHTREAAEKELQLERYAADLRETFKSERARSDELQRSYVATVRSLTNAVEARDAYTGKHAERVAAYGLELATRIDPDLAAEPETEFGFLLHDIGKVAIPDGVLHKPEPLTAEEEALMQGHATIGGEILANIPFLDRARQIVRHHHERWDGTGYPDGLKGAEIPLVARIFSVADTLDAITTHRPYRPAASLEDARATIAEGAGTQFDPGVVAVLKRVPDEAIERIRTGIV